MTGLDRDDPATMLEAALPSRSQRPFIVGLDFGTHSTKVVIRERAEKTARVERIEESTDGYPWFAVPSLVCIENGKVYFGRSAFLRKGGTLIRSLKVDLLSTLSGQRLPPGLYPDFLVACYLAWVLQRIRENLRSSGDPPIYLNVAAPMSHVGNSALRHRYLEVVNAAWAATYGDLLFAVKDGIELEELRQFFIPLFQERVPERQDRRFEVHAETCASIVSLSQNPQMAPGMYMIIDMGAGTTEFSMNLVNEPGADQRVTCYSDKSVPIGGDVLEVIDGLPANVANVQRDSTLREIISTYRRVWSRPSHYRAL